jgi:hypothetical protein
MESQTPPGWYADMTAPGRERYWDGAVWTEQSRPVQIPRASSNAGSSLEKQMLQELQKANRLLLGIQQRTGVVAVVILVSLIVVAVAVGARP